MTQPLSPAAQAVLDAYGNQIGGIDAIMGSERRGVAAALRAVADNAPAPHHHEEMAFHSGFWAGIEYIRSIAAELEGCQ